MIPVLSCQASSSQAPTQLPQQYMTPEFQIGISLAGLRQVQVFEYVAIVATVPSFQVWLSAQNQLVTFSLQSNSWANEKAMIQRPLQLRNTDDLDFTMIWKWSMLSVNIFPENCTDTLIWGLLG